MHTNKWSECIYLNILTGIWEYKLWGPPASLLIYSNAKQPEIHCECTVIAKGREDLCPGTWVQHVPVQAVVQFGYSKGDGEGLMNTSLSEPF